MKTTSLYHPCPDLQVDPGLMQLLLALIAEVQSARDKEAHLSRRLAVAEGQLAGLQLGPAVLPAAVSPPQPQHKRARTQRAQQPQQPQEQPPPPPQEQQPPPQPPEQQKIWRERWPPTSAKTHRDGLPNLPEGRAAALAAAIAAVEPAFSPLATEDQRSAKLLELKPTKKMGEFYKRLEREMGIPEEMHNYFLNHYRQYVWQIIGLL